MAGIFDLLPTYSKSINPSLSLSDKDTTQYFKKERKYHYFLSDRENVTDVMHLYKIKAYERALTTFVIRGNFEIIGSPIKRAKISVYNSSNNNLVGIYNTNKNTGNYLMILVPNVKYELSIEIKNYKGYAPIKTTLEIPFNVNLSTYPEISRQKITITEDSTGVRSEIKNWFVFEDEEVDFLLTVYDKENVQKTTSYMDLYDLKDTRVLKATNNIADQPKKKGGGKKNDQFSKVDQMVKEQLDIENKKPAKAQSAFFSKDYETALSLYSKLLLLDPLDPLMNYRCGVSIFKMNRQKDKAISHLRIASSSKQISYDALYYLGVAQHSQARFTDAIASFEKYKVKAKMSEVDNLSINRLIEMCKNGHKFMEEQLNIEVLSRELIKGAKLPDGYESHFVDSIVMKKSPYFISPYDKKIDERLLMCISADKKTMIQTSYGLKGETGKNLYKNIMLDHGRWGLSQALGTAVNTSYDEAFPYISRDGRTLYFSSNGHNTMGGYDIFKSAWDDSTKSWMKPINMGYPINSPNDDILFITDSTGEYAYYSTNRKTEGDKYHLVKVRLPKDTLPLSIIKGHFMTLDSSYNVKARIDVYNTNNDALVGVYNTNMKTGKYLMALRSGVEYRYVVRSKGYKEHLAVVTLPVQSDYFILKQEIRLKKDGAFEVLKIKNYFTAEEAAKAPTEYTIPTKNSEKNESESSGSTDVQPGDKKVVKRRELTPGELKRLQVADSCFSVGDYQRAVKIYSRFAVDMPLNVQHTYWYAISTFHTVIDKKEAIPLLEKSASASIIPAYDVFYYLGRANQLSYRFSRAEKAFEKFKKNADPLEVKKLKINKLIQESINGKALVNDPGVVEVFEKRTITQSNLQRSMNDLDFAGAILLTPDDLRSDQDKTKQFQSFLFLNQAKNTIFYTSYGESGINGKDLYMIKKLPSGSWAAPENMGPFINTQFDEDYPWVSEDGKTLYFSSKGHKGMGGYDIYRCTWDTKKQKWSLPKNMGAPINSPYNDFYFVF